MTGTAGADGLSTLTATSSEPAGANCAAGGVRLQAGLDTNRNQTLDTGEVTPSATRYVCNGAAGMSVTSAAEPSGANCSAGGVRVTGADGNQYVCHETPATLLSKLVTVDGPGSGLDADTVDGLNGSQLVQQLSFPGLFASSFNAQHPAAFDARLATLFGTDNATNVNTLGGDCMMAEINLTAATYAPPGTMFAAGQLLSIQMNSALYALIGVRYGGDGVTNFRVPDLRKQAPDGTHYTICHSGVWPSRP